MNDETTRAILVALVWASVLVTACALLVLGTNP